MPYCLCSKTRTTHTGSSKFHLGFFLCLFCVTYCVFFIFFCFTYFSVQSIQILKYCSMYALPIVDRELSVFCSLIGLLSSRHIPRFHSVNIILCNIVLLHMFYGKNFISQFDLWLTYVSSNLRLFRYNMFNLNSK